MASDGDNVERLIDLGIVPTLINLLQVNSVFVIYKVCLYRKKLDVMIFVSIEKAETEKAFCPILPCPSNPPPRHNMLQCVNFAIWTDKLTNKQMTSNTLD